jgi:hypothetical protein
MKIVTLQTMRMPSGVRMVLTDTQRDARRHLVAIDADGVALVLSPLEFKSGEELEIIGDLPNAIPLDRYSVLPTSVLPASQSGLTKAKKPKATK